MPLLNQNAGKYLPGQSSWLDAPMSSSDWLKSQGWESYTDDATKGEGWRRTMGRGDDAGFEFLNRDDHRDITSMEDSLRIGGANYRIAMGLDPIPSNWKPRTGDIPSFQEWLASKGEGYSSRGQPPYGEYFNEYWELPKNKGDFLGTWGPRAAMLGVGAAGAFGPGGFLTSGAPAAAGSAPLASQSVGALGETALPAASLGGSSEAALSFVDPWEVMGDPAAFGLGGSSASAAGTAAGAAGSGGAQTASGGLIDSVLKWGKDNQLLAATGVSVLGGMLRGAMEPSPKDIARAAAQRDIAVANDRRAANNLSQIDMSRLKPTGKRLPRPGLIARNS